MEQEERMTRVLTDQEGRERTFQYALLEGPQEGRYGVSVAERRGGESAACPG